MRKLAAEELNLVSGGFGFGDDPPDPPVVVREKRRSEPDGGWGLWDNQQFVRAWNRYNQIERLQDQETEAYIRSAAAIASMIPTLTPIQQAALEALQRAPVAKRLEEFRKFIVTLGVNI
jgi:Lon protease-like protein